MNVTTPSTLIDFLKNVGAKPLKALSQNFLIDKNIIKKIIAAADIQKNDVVLEIGPGPGALTYEILAKNAEIIAIERDQTFAKNLKTLPIEVYEEDFLKFPLKEHLEKKDKKIKVVANLPYHIATPIIFKLLECHHLISSMTLMVQLEMGKRILSLPNSKNYGALNVLIDFYFEAKILFDISKNSFLPMPHVTSAILGFISKNKENIDHGNFQAFVKNCFFQRRKKLSSSLKKDYTNEKIKNAYSKLNLNQDIRAENLKSLDFFNLFQLLN